jgi:transposase-like protein
MHEHEEESKMSKKQRISTEMKANIADALAGGSSYAVIAARYGVSYSTIQRVKSAVINGEEFIVKKKVTEVHDTPTEQKKSPETVSTPIEPVLEDITHSGSPAGTNIIPDVPENVKQEESYDTTLLNPTVCGAVLDRINKTDEELAALRRDITLLEKEKKALEDYLRKYKEAQNNGT